ncbi:ribonuclease T2-like isoform X3 [Micropterus salmoides]|uniref:ribonuclease T2-like isoform X3 n=1 Tax=Micropterus salmoides TaxID=27706 RepID=UPI0018EBF458|nr:ribonuclease T2-like isoform X3 [Micropterus salmoides]
MWCSVLPLLVNLSPAVLFLLQLPGCTATREGTWEDYKYGNQGSELQDKKHFCSWKCLLFTLQWPAGFCQSLNKETLCRIPQNINNWTIHGLWPLRVKSCCDCWPVFHSDVQELEAELTEHWPSLLKVKSSFHFWREEWEKHGVCAACVEGMNSPLRFFQICLKLRGRFDIYKLLEDAAITPSCERPYKLSGNLFPLMWTASEAHPIRISFLCLCRLRRFSRSWLHIWVTNMSSSVLQTTRTERCGFR